MQSQASTKNNKRHSSIDPEHSTDSTDEQPSHHTQQAPKTDSPAAPKQAHLSHTHKDPIQSIQDSYEADRLVSYYRWHIQHHEDQDDSRTQDRPGASPWQDQQVLWSMAATRRRELEKRNRRTKKLMFGFAAAVVLVVIVIMVVFLV
ncbi:uncharacterized protein PgNI_00644 [Pyricularia grisea]|uniref:Uncharacterized protein n=1 Tax=Pyricularia grisea TaxID=148305 RepID=A0A6P8BI33_PYRGI|nr:uncharacterized protein PgNI_00644 [Pyricularia grisea]TLD16443.1 hypothetical protein PgNI_00644 [Pyricularia grisea]